MAALPQQKWLTKRLDGLTAADFASSVRFLCTSNLEPPAELRSVWLTCKYPEIAAALAEEELFPCGPNEVVLIICDPTDTAEIDLASQALQAMDRLEDDAPATLLIPHTVDRSELGEESEAALVEKPTIKNLIANVVELGLRDYLANEPAGFNLALAVRSKIEVMAAVRARVFNDLMVRREFLHEVSSVQQRTSRLLWEYLRVRLSTCIPPIDANLEVGARPNIQLPGYTRGRFLGEGSFGKVYSLTDSEGNREAVKVVRKKGLREFNDVLQVNRMIKVMTKLREEEWNHPGIAHLHQVYHSPSYFLFRMEFGGRENLLHRVQRRDLIGEREAPLACDAVNSIIRQVVNVVAHLHLGPQVYHRDINPANFIVMEAEDQVQVKLVDFEFAMVHDGKMKHRSRCGTLPFIAPEVFLEEICNWFAADIWSLGMTILEVTSTARVFDRALGLSAQDFRQHMAADTLKKVRNCFEKPGSARTILENNCREELKPLLPLILNLATGMLNTRWPARAIAGSLAHTLASK